MAAASTYGCRFQIKMESTKEREREKERQKTDKDKTRHKTSKRRKESTHLPTPDSLRVVVACRLSESHVFPPSGHLVLVLVCKITRNLKKEVVQIDVPLRNVADVRVTPELSHDVGSVVLAHREQTTLQGQSGSETPNIPKPAGLGSEGWV